MKLAAAFASLLSVALSIPSARGQFPEDGFPEFACRDYLYPNASEIIAPGTLVKGTNGLNAGAMTMEHELWSTPENRYDFSWPDDATREAAIEDGTFIDYNINVAGVKSFKGRWFMTIPRWKQGVPATVVEYLPKGSDVKGASSDKEIFKPWPSWTWNRYSDGTTEDCKTTIQYTHDVLPDVNGRLWVLDIGAKDLFASTREYVCPPKIMAFDIEACDEDPENCKPVQYYEFPSDCVRFPKGTADNPSLQFLNDLTVDPVSDWIYITDSNHPNAPNDDIPGSEYTGGVIALHIGHGICNRLSSVHTDIIQDIPDGTGSKIMVNGDIIPFFQSANGIALDPNNDDVIFSSFGVTTWKIPGSALRDPTLTNDERAAQVVRAMVKDDPSDGITVDPQGNIWSAGVQTNSVRKYIRDKWGYFNATPETIFTDCELGQWFDTFGDDVLGDSKMFSASNMVPIFFCESVTHITPCLPAKDRVYAIRIFSTPTEGGTSQKTIKDKEDTWMNGWPDYEALKNGMPTAAPSLAPDGGATPAPDGGGGTATAAPSTSPASDPTGGTAPSPASWLQIEGCVKIIVFIGTLALSFMTV